MAPTTIRIDIETHARCWSSAVRADYLDDAELTDVAMASVEDLWISEVVTMLRSR